MHKLDFAEACIPLREGAFAVLLKAFFITYFLLKVNVLHFRSINNLSQLRPRPHASLNIKPAVCA